MTSRCSLCHATADELTAARGVAVMVTHTLKLWRRTVEWTLCGWCNEREEKQ